MQYNMCDRKVIQDYYRVRAFIVRARRGIVFLVWIYIYFTDVLCVCAEDFLLFFRVEIIINANVYAASV